MCRVLRLHPSGYYAWKAQPQSQRAIDDQRLLGLLKQAWLESGGVYGYRKLTLDMRDMGEQCSRHRVARLLRCAGIKAQRGYGKRPCAKGGVPAAVAPNLLSQQFTVKAPNKVWVTDITYISTHKGWLYLATVIDLFSRQVIGWATGPEGAKTRLENIKKSDLKAIQIKGTTLDMVKEWQAFYENEVVRNPCNPTASYRAQLMKKTAQLWVE